MKEYESGNVERDLKLDLVNHRGWIVGNFIDDELRNSDDLEVKYSRNKKGYHRKKWSLNKYAKTLCFLISGKMEFILEEQTIVLNKGDYFISRGGVPHKVRYLEDSLTITIRWPSLADDHEDIL